MLDSSLNAYVLRLDHTAIAVHRIRDALHLYRDLLGGEYHAAGEVPHLGFRWAQFVYAGGGSKIELLEPLDADGFVARFLARYGEGVHHLTFKVHRIEELVGILRERGLRVVDEDYRDPTWKEAFISPRSAHGTIIQLAESNLTLEDERREWHLDLEDVLAP